jgi:hypothetical protein
LFQNERCRFHIMLWKNFVAYNIRWLIQIIFV